MSEPAVTVVTPTFRRHRALREAIDSVKRQTFESFEHIVIADGHDERAAAVVRQAQDPRIRYACTHRTNGDWGHTPRNAALQMASGKLICCLDDDNLYRPRYLERMVAAIGDDEGFSVCGIAHPAYAGGRLCTPLPPVKGYIDHLCFMIRTDLVRRVGGWSRVYAADFILISAVAAVSKGAVVPEVLADYRFLADATARWRQRGERCRARVATLTSLFQVRSGH